MTTSNEHSTAPPVPQGWKLVPVEPTRAMWAAVNKLDDEMAAGSYDGKGCSIEQAWNCMLDFAPDAPALAATQAPAPAVPEQELSALLTTSLPYMTPVGRARLGQDIAQLYSSVSAPAPAQEIDKSVADAEIKAMYVESQGSDKGWLGIEGSYFICGVVAARRQKKATKPAQGEPFGYFRAEPFGWTDCAEDDEGAIALYEHAQEVGLTDEEIKHVCAGIYLSDHPQGSASYDVALARAIIAALRAKGGKL